MKKWYSLISRFPKNIGQRSRRYARLSCQFAIVRTDTPNVAPNCLISAKNIGVCWSSIRQSICIAFIHCFHCSRKQNGMLTPVADNSDVHPQTQWKEFCFCSTSSTKKLSESVLNSFSSFTPIDSIESFRDSLADFLGSVTGEAGAAWVARMGLSRS